MLPWRSIAFLAVFFGASGLSLVLPIVGVSNYLLIYQIFPEHTWWHIPLEPMGIRYSMTAAVFMMSGMVLALPRMRSVRPALSVWDLSALGLVVVVGMCEFIGLEPTAASPGLVDKFVKMILFVFCMTRITTTRRNFSIVIWSFVVGSIYIGYDAWTAPPSAFARGRLDGVGGPDFRHASGLAAHMAMMLPLIAVTFMAIRSWLLRPIVVISGMLTVNAIVLCRTRSAFVGLCCGAVAAVLFAPKKRRMITLLAILIALWGTDKITDSLYWERMSTLQSKESISQDSAAMFRLQIWREARGMIRDHPLGVGIGNFIPTIGKRNPQLGRRAAHNTLVLCWAELGMQGITLFVILLGASFVQTWQCHQRAEQTHDPPWTRYMAYGLFISLITCMGTQMFTERLYTEAFWWILALPGCLKRVVIREAAEKRVRSEQQNQFSLDRWIENNPLLPDGYARGAFA